MVRGPAGGLDAKSLALGSRTARGSATHGGLRGASRLGGLAGRGGQRAPCGCVVGRAAFGPVQGLGLQGEGPGGGRRVQGRGLQGEGPGGGRPVPRGRAAPAGGATGARPRQGPGREREGMRTSRGARVGCRLLRREDSPGCGPAPPRAATQTGGADQVPRGVQERRVRAGSGARGRVPGKQVPHRSRGRSARATPPGRSPAAASPCAVPAAPGPPPPAPPPLP